MSRQFQASAKAESKPAATLTQSWLLQNSRGDRDLSQESKSVAAPQILHEALNIPIHSTDRPVIQPKLTIGAVGDKYEQEADRVADKITNRINSPQSGVIQCQEMPEEEEQLQMRPESGFVQREDSPEEDDDQEKLQMKSLIQRQISMDNSPIIPDLETNVRQQLGRGRPLPESVRKPMEHAFGINFASIKVHTDAASDQLNRALHARAFTTQQDIFFRYGEYSPESSVGQKLLAHELTHVVQQTGKQDSLQTPQSSTILNSDPSHAGKVATTTDNPEHWQTSSSSLALRDTFRGQGSILPTSSLALALRDTLRGDTLRINRAVHNTRYQKRKYKFVTDAKDRTVRAEGPLVYVRGGRVATMKVAYKRKGDASGHLIAHSLGGPPSIKYNYVAMNAKVNSAGGDWGRMEAYVRRRMKKKGAWAYMEVYPQYPNAKARRPDVIQVKVYFNRRPKNKSFTIHTP